MILGCPMQNGRPSQSCGGKYKGQPVMLGSTVYLVCEQGSENLQFTPSSTGTYRFTATAASAGEVALVVSKVLDLSAV